MVIERGFNAVIVMARLPRAGKVKSRLAASLGDQEAAMFYKLCAEQVFSAVGKLPDDTHKYLFCAGKGEAKEANRWAGPAFGTFVQKGADIGKRLADAFKKVFADGSNCALAVATDVPDLSASILSAAFNSLRKHDLVLGPCFDGGYYLIGINRLHRQLFHGIPWSTERVTSATLERAARLRLAIEQLPTLWDIDSGSDLKAWAVSGLSPQDSPLNRFVRGLGLPDIASASLTGSNSSASG